MGHDWGDCFGAEMPRKFFNSEELVEEGANL
jgi:hypothetical protein